MNSPTDLHDDAYEKLRSIARQQFAASPVGHTLQATAVAHEAFLRVCASRTVADPDELVRLASKAIRSVLVDHARSKAALKRNSADREALVQVLLERQLQLDPDDSLDLHEALRKLEEASPRLHDVVELRVFGGCDVRETARALNLSERTVKGDWARACDWLRSHIG